jgi:hypothetical protein
MMLRALPVLVACALAQPSLHAHHSIAGVYDSAQRRQIKGVVTEFQFVNPHPFVVVEVASSEGPAQVWRLEMDNRRELVEIGFTSDTIRPGDAIVASGSLARRTPNNLYISRLDRPSDGFWYEQVGSSPRARRP